LDDLNQIDFAPVYGGTSGPDALNDFLIPALSVSTSYDRVAGYFSSAVFMQIAPGVTPLVRRGGKIRLVTSHSFTSGDAAALLKDGANEDAINRLASEFEAAVKHSSSDLTRQMQSQYIQAMCWLLKNNQLEIRVVVPTDGLNNSPEKFHSKFGILKDSSGNTVVFSGSINETWLAWSKNIENVSIYSSGVPQLQPYLLSYQSSFDDIWAGNLGKDWRCVDLPAALKEGLISLAPPGEFPDIETGDFRQKEEQANVRQPRNYQLEAVLKWEDAGRKGLLEMATGTGKTLTARMCVESAFTQGTLLAVVVAPYQHVADQWAKELAEFNPLQIGVRGSWRKELLDIEYEASMGSYQLQIVIAVKNTASSDAFIERTNSISKYFENFLFIADEVHWLGARSLQSAMNQNANFRLGLSATPDRYYDDEGTQVLRDYFGFESVYRFDLKRALGWPDPATGLRGVLAPYSYHPIFVSLTPDENADFVKFSKQIAQKAAVPEKTREDLEEIDRLKILRSNIAKSAENKLPAYGELLEKLNSELSQAIVYCADFRQMEKVMEISRERGVDTGARITGLEGTGKSSYYRGLSEREHILKNFAAGNHGALFAIDCLDEGVDVPSAQLGIILASSGNPKEFIQRRGRLMRKAPGKLEACIYDFVVLPDDGSGPESLKKVELARVAEFAELATNKDEVETLVVKY